MSSWATRKPSINTTHQISHYLGSNSQNKNIREPQPKREYYYDVLKNHVNHENIIKNTVFVILRHSRDPIDYTIFKQCYTSIKIFYPLNKIIIIDDNSLYRDEKYDDSIDATFIKSEFPGAGEILPYYYFNKYKWNNNMIFLHDSMSICRHFTYEELNSNCNFLWRFKVDDNTDRELLNIIHSLIDKLNNNILLKDYFTKQYNKLTGCFGVTSFIRLSVLEKIEEKYGFVSILSQNISNRRQREALERVFALIMTLEGELSNSMFGDIHNYPKSFNTKILIPLDLKLYNYYGAITKIWRGR